MTTSPTVADVASEAEFQLMVAKDNLDWIAALVRAVHLSHAHAKVGDAEALVGLAKYLEDTNFGGIESEIKRFRQVYDEHSAPQKPTSAKSGAGGAA